MLTDILAIIAPVFLIILIGYGVGSFQQINLTTINKLNIDVFCPLLVYSTLSSSELSIANLLPLMLGGVAIVLGSGLLALCAAKLLHLPIKAICPTSMFNNCGNMGLPLGFFAAGELGLQIIISLFVVSNTLHFTVGSKIVGGQLKWRKILMSPMILATLAGVVSNSLDIHLFTTAEIALKMLGDITVPLMLFALGVRMCDVVWGDVKIGLLGAILCPLTGLLLAWLLSPVFGFSGLEKQMFFLFAALPPGVLNFMLAEKYQVEPKSVASIVLIGNILAVLFVPIGLMLGY